MLISYGKEVINSDFCGFENLCTDLMHISSNSASKDHKYLNS